MLRTEFSLRFVACCAAVGGTMCWEKVVECQKKSDLLWRPDGSVSSWFCEKEMFLFELDF